MSANNTTSEEVPPPPPPTTSSSNTRFGLPTTRSNFRYQVPTVTTTTSSNFLLREPLLHHVRFQVPTTGRCSGGGFIVIPTTTTTTTEKKSLHKLVSKRHQSGGAVSVGIKPSGLAVRERRVVVDYASFGVDDPEKLYDEAKEKAAGVKTGE